MGYAGGVTASPTYRAIADHSEAVEIGYDPSRIGHAELLDELFEGHAPRVGSSRSRQYRSAVFVRDADERAGAEAALARAVQRVGHPIAIAIEDAGPFWLAEAYHQKYRLRSSPKLWAALTAIHPELDDLLHSTEAARLNAWVAGYGGEAELTRELDAMALPAEARAELRLRRERRAS